MENNLKNCINIDLKCLLDLVSRMEFPRLFDLLTQRKNSWSFLFSAAFICSSSLIIRSVVVSHRCLVRYCRERPRIKWVLITAFLEIYWLIDWIESCPNNSSPPNKLIYFTVKAEKNKRVWSLHHRGCFTLIANNSRVTLTNVKNIQKTRKYPKKK